MDNSHLPIEKFDFVNIQSKIHENDEDYKTPTFPFLYFQEDLFHNVPFGHAMKANFVFKDILHLNNGAFGAAPRVVLESAKSWLEFVEKDPFSFYGQHLFTAQIQIIRALASFVHSKPANIFLVDNATSAINLILRTVQLTKEDEVICFNIGFESVRATLSYLSSIIGFKVVIVPVKIPIVMDQLVESFGNYLTGNSKLAIIDHISCATGCILPIEEIIPICKKRQIITVIDGAHGVGQIPLYLEGMDVDFYISDCHKWLYSAKGSAFLYVDSAFHSKIHPNAISFFYGEGPQKEFLYTGTNSYTAKLSTLAALDFINKVGGQEKITEYCHSLVWKAANLIKNAWNTHFVVSESNEGYEKYFGNMAAIALPLPTFKEASLAQGHATWLHNRLVAKKLEVSVTVIEGRIYIRISAQIWNELSDYLALLSAVTEIYKEIGINI